MPSDQLCRHGRDELHAGGAGEGPPGGGRRLAAQPEAARQQPVEGGGQIHRLPEATDLMVQGRKQNRVDQKVHAVRGRGVDHHRHLRPGQERHRHLPGVGHQQRWHRRARSQPQSHRCVCVSQTPQNTKTIKTTNNLLLDFVFNAADNNFNHCFYTDDTLRINKSRSPSQEPIGN
jgi:hypothetical protein